MKVTGSGTATTETSIATKRRLYDLTSGFAIASSLVSGGWLRVYLGNRDRGSDGSYGFRDLFNGGSHGSVYRNDYFYSNCFIIKGFIRDQKNYPFDGGTSLRLRWHG